MKTPKIKFSAKWDKLKPDRFKTGRIFTTARKYTQAKGAYYFRRLHKTWDVVLNSKLIGQAVLISMGTKYRYELTLDWIKKDTHENWSRDDFKKLMRRYYHKDDVGLIVLEFEITAVFK